MSGIQSVAQHQSKNDTAKNVTAKVASELQPGAQRIHDIMMKAAKMTVDGKMPMHHDTDRAFGLVMAEQHLVGARLAKAEVDHGNDPAMKAVAKKMMAAHQKEAAQLKALAAKAK